MAITIQSIDLSVEHVDEHVMTVPGLSAATRTIPAYDVYRYHYIYTTDDGRTGQDVFDAKAPLTDPEATIIAAHEAQDHEARMEWLDETGRL